MSVSVNSDSIFEKVFDGFKKLTPALAAIGIASGLIILLPGYILEKMALNDLPDTWKRIIGIVFIVSIALIVTIVGVSVYRAVENKLAPRRFRATKRKQYINLSAHYKTILLQILSSKECSIELDPTSGDTLYLLNNQFIHQTQSYMFVGPGYTAPVVYTPQPWLIDLYHKEPELFEMSGEKRP